MQSTNTICRLKLSLKVKPMVQVGRWPIVKDVSLMQLRELCPIRVWPGWQLTSTTVPTMTGNMLVVVMSDTAAGSFVHISEELRAVIRPMFDQQQSCGVSKLQAPLRYHYNTPQILSFAAVLLFIFFNLDKTINFFPKKQIQNQT